MNVQKKNRLAWSCALAIACAIPAGCLTSTGTGTDTDSTADSKEEVAETQDALCAGPACNPKFGPAQYKISPSLVVSRDTESIIGLNDTPILDAVFPLKDVVFQLLSHAGTSSFQSPDDWLARLWDTQNKAPGTFNESYQAHCSDNGATINGFPIDCARPEGQLSSNVTTDDFFPTAVFNRFDLAPEDGAHCGEYRIIYAMKNTTSGGVNGSNFIIFEGQLENPNPECGIEACRPVVQFWSNLSAQTSQGAIAKRLHQFYFTGIPGFSPVITPKHYGLGAKPGGGYGTGGGQIRTNQFVDFQLWQLREFQLDMGCDAAGCNLVSRPVTVKNNPFFDLFDTLSVDPRAPAFQSSFTVNIGGNSQVSRLAVSHPNTITNLNLIGMDISDKFNAGQSTPQGSPEAYLPPFSTVPGNTFENDIQNELASIGSPLTPNEIVFRANVENCEGCHASANGQNIGNGLTWPNSNGFTHVDENGTLSQALQCVFLPHRQAIGIGFLQNCGKNPPPIAPATKLCSSFQSGGGGYDPGIKEDRVITDELKAQAAEAGAPSPVRLIGGGSKIN